MSTSTPTEQNKLTTVGIVTGVIVIIMTILIMAVIGMLSMFYCLVLKKKKSKLKDIVVNNIDITSEESITVVCRNRISSTTPLYNESTNSKKLEDYYEINDNEVLDYNS